MLLDVISLLDKNVWAFKKNDEASLKSYQQNTKTVVKFQTENSKTLKIPFNIKDSIFIALAAKW